MNTKVSNFVQIEKKSLEVAKSIFIPTKIENPKIEAFSIHELHQEAKKISSSVGVLKMQTANECMNEARNMPTLKMLFDTLWFEVEICILFADTNIGKSILAVLIAQSIASGIKINGFRIETTAQKVLYFDAEMTSRQFRNRYKSDYPNGKDFEFSDNFFRLEIDPDNIDSENESDFEKKIIESIRTAIDRTGAKILIIDNITYLRSNNEKAGDALPLMKELKRLKSEFDLSILVLAHTPKRDFTKPLTKNDIAGSKMLINFCDSAFAIGESAKSSNLRYIKQIKTRNAEFVFDAENVPIFEVKKTGTDSNFLSFDLLEHSTEREHLKELTEDEQDDISEKVLELKNEGKSDSEISRILKINKMKVGRILKRNT